MPIDRNAGGNDNGSYINQPGEYRVRVEKLETGLSKKGDKMLTVFFKTNDDQGIRSFFVQKLPQHLKALAALKFACGKTEADRAETLIGRECGILVEPQKPNQDTGRVFMNIVGYGLSSQVGEMGGQQQQPSGESDFAPSSPPYPGDDVPF